MCEACAERSERVTFTAEHEDREVAYATAWDRFVASGISAEPHARAEHYKRAMKTWHVEFTAYRAVS